MKVIFLLLLSPIIWAAEIKILNFNTMCDFCSGSSFFNYDKRLKNISKVLAKHKPDLMSLQEIRTVSQVNVLLKDLPEYDYIATESSLASYADPVIIYRKEKFKVLSKKNYWLGPNEGDFSFGWKMAVPRQLLVAKLEYEQKEFFFLSSHFDNLRLNLTNSAHFLNKIVKKLEAPVIFAGDTNIPLDMRSYSILTETLQDAFKLKKSFQVIGDYSSDRDLCYTKKGKVFPSCRVEHFLLSSNYDWKVSQFIVDASKDNNGKFLSDHRIFLIELSLP